MNAPAWFLVGLMLAAALILGPELLFLLHTMHALSTALSPQ